MSAAGPLPVRVDMISDVICPWCYVGFRAFLLACAQRPDVPVSLTMRAFALDPTIPKGGVDRKQRLLEKFGGDEARLKAMSAPLIEAGQAVGIDFAFDRIARTPNTLDCHRLMLWARSAHAEADLMCAEALFQAYHVEGEDLAQPGTLVAIARGIGMDGDLVADLLASDSDVAAIEAEMDIARRMGVTGVPCSVFNQQFAVMGAQGVAEFVAAIDRAAAGGVAA
jgi:predicted DsbA family dithiol-disulfide isomerase